MKCIIILVIKSVGLHIKKNLFHHIFMFILHITQDNLMIERDLFH